MPRKTGSRDACTAHCECGEGVQIFKQSCLSDDISTCSHVGFRTSYAVDSQVMVLASRVERLVLEHAFCSEALQNHHREYEVCLNEVCLNILPLLWIAGREAE